MPPPAWFFSAIAVMTWLGVLVPGRTVLEGGWSLLGLLPIGIGVALNFAAVHAFRRHATTTDPDGAPSALVADGVYRFTRNPMYLGGVVILIGYAMLLGAATPFAVPPLYALLASRGFIAKEERRLAALFGDEWRSYASRTPRGL